MNIIYLTGVIGMLVGLVALGAVAIDQAYQMHKEMVLSPPGTPVPSLYILVDDDKLALHNGFPFLKVEKGESASIRLTIKSETDKTLRPELSITYGPGNEEPVLPEGINAEFNPKVIELLPRHESRTNLTLHTDKDAPDGTYVIGITAYDKKNNEGIGNSFTLVVGNGSRFYMGPTGPIGPAPKFETMTAQPIDIRSLPVDEYKALYKLRFDNAYTIASNHPLVKQEIGTASLAVSSFDFLDNSEKMILQKAWDSRTVSGDWRSGYLTTYKGGKTIEIEIDRITNAVISLQIIPMADFQEPVTFTDNQKRILGILFDDSRVKAELRGLVESRDYWVQMVRDYNLGSKERGHSIAIINIYSPDGNKLLQADFDLVTNEVFAIRSNFRQGGS